MDNKCELSIVIVNWKVRELLKKSLNSILCYPPQGTYEVFVVDNASNDGSVEMVKKEFPWVELIASKVNLGFAAGNNLALEKVQGDVVLLLNPDTEVLAGALQTYLDFFKTHEKAGAMGVKLLNSDRTLQPSCKGFPSFWTLLWNAFYLDIIFSRARLFGSYEMKYFKYDKSRQVDQPMGAALAVRKGVLADIGLMDENYFMFFDEVDWCYRIKKRGYEIWFTPEASIIHHWAQSTSQALLNMNFEWHKSFLYFLQKHSKMPLFLTSILFFAVLLIKVLVTLLIIVFGSKQVLLLFKMILELI
jgi:GT2 family glycosyltransferase